MVFVKSSAGYTDFFSRFYLVHITNWLLLIIKARLNNKRILLIKKYIYVKNIRFLLFFSKKISICRAMKGLAVEGLHGNESHNKNTYAQEWLLGIGAFWSDQYSADYVNCCSMPGIRMR